MFRKIRSTLALVAALCLASPVAFGSNVYEFHLFAPGIQPTTVVSTPTKPPVNAGLMLHMDASPVVDSAVAPNSITMVGGAAISTAVKKFGSGSLYINGTTDALTILPNAALHLSGDFTIEGWVYLTGSNSFWGYIMNKGGGLNIAWSEYELYLSGNALYFAASSANTAYDIGGESSAGKVGTVSSNQWSHFAITRQGNVYRGFINGVQGFTQTTSLTPYDSNAGNRGLVIGNAYKTTWGTTSNLYEPTVGYLDDLRIIKGYAAYTSNFTPPAAPLANSVTPQ